MHGRVFSRLLDAVQGIELVGLSALQGDIVVARLGCLELTRLRLLRLRGPIWLLLAEALVEGVALFAVVISFMILNKF